MSEKPSIPIACDLTAIPVELRGQHEHDREVLMQSVEAIEELPNGYAFRFANVPDKLLEIANFVELERRCCPFFTFTIEVEPGGGYLWLRLTGDEEVKAFTKAQFMA